MLIINNNIYNVINMYLIKCNLAYECSKIKRFVLLLVRSFDMEKLGILIIACMNVHCP